MDADGVEVADQTALAHEAEPVGVDRAHAAQNGLFAALVSPVGGTAGHFAEGVPEGVEGDVPFAQVVWFVPQLDPFEVFAETGDHQVEEVGVAFGVARRGGGFGDDAPGRRGVDEAGQDVDVAGELGEEPGVPGFAFGCVPVGPGNAGAQGADAETFEVGQDAVNAFVLTGAEPLEHSDKGVVWTV